MTSTPPPADQTPLPLSYPSAEGRVGHRWGAGVVVLIVALVALIAVVIAAVVIWTRGPSEETPPKPSDTGNLLGSSAPASPVSGGRRDAAVIRLASTGASYLADGDRTVAQGDSVEVADGISITPAPGWKVARQWDQDLLLLNNDGTAAMYVLVGAVESRDIQQVLSDDIQWETDQVGLTDVKLGDFGESNKVTSNVFNQSLGAPYAAVMPTQQGTQQIYGIFFELLNTKTGQASFIDLSALSQEELDAAVKDADTMVNSML